MRRAAFALAFAAPAAAAPPLLGVKGDASRFHSLAGQQSQLQHAIVGFGQGDSWGSQFSALFSALGPVPMLGPGTSRYGREAIAPLARG